MRDVVQWQLLLQTVFFMIQKMDSIKCGIRLGGLMELHMQRVWTDKTGIDQIWDVVPGTNMVLPFRKGYKRDGATVWIDHETKDPKSRYKLFVFFRKKRSKR